MSEIRHDPVTGACTIIAPEREGRPKDSRTDRASPPDPAFDPGCPFCPGNERLLPAILAETPSDRTPGWTVRVVPNKYPAVTRQSQGRPDAGPDAAYGAHRVIVETPRHAQAFEDLPGAEAAEILHMYHRQLLELADDPATRIVILFRNHGALAGASLNHPHSQIISLDTMPPRLAAMAERAADRYRSAGRCIICDYLEWELAEAGRIVETTARFALFVPYAASGPCELQILPRQHQSSFAECGPEGREELSGLLQRAVWRLKRTLGDISFRWVVDSTGRPGTPVAHLHWRMRLLPQLGMPGGFEFATGMSISHALPEADAESLRDAGEI